MKFKKIVAKTTLAHFFLSTCVYLELSYMPLYQTYWQAILIVHL